MVFWSGLGDPFASQNFRTSFTRTNSGLCSCYFCLVKFLFFVRYLVNHLSHLVVSNVGFLLCQFAAFAYYVINSSLLLIFSFTFLQSFIRSLLKDFRWRITCILCSIHTFECYFSNHSDCTHLKGWAVPQKAIFLYFMWAGFARFFINVFVYLFLENIYGPHYYRHSDSFNVPCFFNSYFQVFVLLNSLYFLTDMLLSFCDTMWVVRQADDLFDCFGAKPKQRAWTRDLPRDLKWRRKGRSERRRAVDKWTQRGQSTTDSRRDELAWVHIVRLFFSHSLGCIFLWP